jgi:hypothetical protein
MTNATLLVLAASVWATASFILLLAMLFDKDFSDFLRGKRLLRAAVYFVATFEWVGLGLCPLIMVWRWA